MRLSNPIAGRKCGEQGFIQIPSDSPIDIFEASLLAELGVAQQTLETRLIPLQAFGLYQKSESFFKRKLMELRLFGLLLEGLRHSGQFQGSQMIQGRLSQHGDVLLR